MVRKLSLVFALTFSALALAAGAEAQTTAAGRTPEPGVACQDSGAKRCDGVSTPTTREPVTEGGAFLDAVAAERGAGACKPQTCGFFTPCFGVACFCFEIVEGGGLCIDDFSCGNPECTTSADCAPGDVCTTNTCCGVNICAPAVCSEIPVELQTIDVE